MSLVAGIDVGGTKVLGVALDPDDPTTVVDEARVPTPDGTAPLLDAMADVVRTLGKDHEIGSVGVGIAGLVDRRGVLRVGPNLPGLHGVRVGDELDARLGHPDPGRQRRHLRHVGRARGRRRPRGRATPCWSRSAPASGPGSSPTASWCGARTASPARPATWWSTRTGRRARAAARGAGSASPRAAGSAAWAARRRRPYRFPRGIELAGEPEDVRGEHVTAAAAEGDADALAVIDHFAGWVALGIGNLLALLDSSLVVIGGGLVEAGDLLLDPVRRALPDLVMAPEERADVRIVAAELGERAGAIGAALLGAREASELASG